MDKVSVLEAEVCGFESRRGYVIFFLIKFTLAAAKEVGSGEIRTHIFANCNVLFDCGLPCLVED